MARLRGPLVAVDDAHCIRETDKALLVRFCDGGQSWVPKSQVYDDSEIYEDGDKGKLIISQWIAEQNDIEGDEYVVCDPRRQVQEGLAVSFTPRPRIDLILAIAASGAPRFAVCAECYAKLGVAIEKLAPVPRERYGTEADAE